MSAKVTHLVTVDVAIHAVSDIAIGRFPQAFLFVVVTQIGLSGKAQSIDIAPIWRTRLFRSALVGHTTDLKRMGVSLK